MNPIIRTQYIDRETGEILTKNKVEKKEYNKIKCNKTTKNLGWNIQITYIWECEKNNQLKLTL